MRRWVAGGVVAVVVAGAAVGVSLATRAEPAGAVTRATAGVVVTVSVGSSTATHGLLQVWKRQANGTYTSAYGPTTAWVGAAGVGATREGLQRTPAGTFGLTEAFGTAANPGTGLPYRRVDGNDWWVSDQTSAYYNTYRRCAPGSCPFNEAAGERLAIPAYANATVIDYNRTPVVRGAGSAFFLHVSNGRPTAGCVAIGPTHLAHVMRLLTPAAKPVISIGVGSAATAGITEANRFAVTRNPIGTLDSATNLGGGRARVAGWALDPDDRTAAVRVHVYADGRLQLAVTTAVSRPDVQRIHSSGPAQGYVVAVPLARGSHQVCTYAINQAYGTGNPRLGCRTVTVT
jgi:L,D-peptidoglycan transpeptidase YkuD (ErfK/YbiS/YcfS/YnhG family)